MVDNAHDQFFKETFTNKENAIDFIQGTFPKEISKNLDFNTIELDHQSYVDETSKNIFPI